MQDAAIQYEQYNSLTGLSYLHTVSGTADTPTVVALHGWLDNSRSFDRLAKTTESRQWLALDLPGHGRSAWSDSVADYSVWGYATRVASFIRNLNRPVDLVCHSMGTTTGLMLAATGLLPIRSITCIDGLGPWVDDSNTFAQQFKRSLQQQLSLDGSIISRDFAVRRFNSVAEAVARRNKLSNDLSVDELMPMVKRNLIQRNGGFAWSTDPKLRAPSMVRLSESHVEAYCRNLNLPVLLITASDSILSGEMVDRRLSYFAQISHQILSGGHHLHMSNSSVGPVARALESFWKSV